MTRDETTAGLRSLPDELDATIHGLGDEDLRRRPRDGGWSILELCCHLRDAASIEHPRLIRLLTEERPHIEPWDQEGLAVERRYNDDDITVVREATFAAWQALATLIEASPPRAWSRGGTHPERGVITFGWRATRQVEHPREHFAQMRALRARMAGI
jgi:hypothetical protein